MTLFCTVFYSLQTALHVSGSDSPTTSDVHRLFAATRCCNYSLFELLMMGESFTRNMHSRLQGIKYCTKKVSSCWNIFEETYAGYFKNF
jgi:hypothetical protein